MKIIGIIAEYNPFHNGHKLLIDKARNELGAEFVIIIMSGNFVQRGEPAIVDKWARTEMCLHNGADLVLELPAIFATASAEGFAYGAVATLNALNILTDIVFGVESDSIDRLIEVATVLADECDAYRLLLGSALNTGVSFPTARQAALSQIIGSNAETLSLPNNVLAIEYIKALIRLGSSIKPNGVRRIGAQHGCDVIDDSRYTASSTAIRAAVSGNMDTISRVMPSDAYSIFLSRLHENGGAVTSDCFSTALHYKIITCGVTGLAEFADVNEGFENRIKALSVDIFPFSALTAALKTKRYTYTRIQRMLTHILIGITKSDWLFYGKQASPKYLRVLGFKKESESILKMISESSAIPLVTNVSASLKKLNADALNLINIDIRATDIYSLGIPNNDKRVHGSDYTTPMVII